MKKLFCKSMIFSFLIIFLTTNVTWGEKLDIQKLNRLIERTRKRWVAAENPKSRLNKKDQQLLCRLKKRQLTGNEFHGKILKNESSDFTVGRAKNFFGEKGFYIPQHDSSFNGLKTVGVPSFFDWRDIDGQDWISSIREQGACGSCWAFASIAVMEATQKIGFNDSYWDTDYSEQFMVSCSEGTCTYGWYLDSSAEFLKSTGAPTEECFPYRGQDLPCENRCEDWMSLINKIPDWNWISGFPQYVTTASIKKKLLNGPLMAGFTVYEDFMHYSHGVYEHVQGEALGEHAVVIIGWDNKDSSWICKNSWGQGWGDSGWFRIKMGQNECGIEEGLIFYSPPISWECDRLESFEEKMELPLEWKTKTQNSNCTWEITKFPVFEGTQAISIEYDPDLKYQDELLMSWEFKGCDLMVSFAFMGSHYWGVSTDNYRVSLWVVKGDWDAGGDDDILITENILKDHLQDDDESWVWYPVTYYLPPEADHSNIRLAFRYQGLDGAQFSLDKVCIKGIQQHEFCECSIEDWGALDISQGSENVFIRIQNAPNEVNTFGYDIIYDPNRLSYNGFEPADFFKNPNFCVCDEINKGQIRCRGGDAEDEGEEKSIPIGYSGTMVTLQFSPIDLAPEGSGVCLRNLTDDIAEWDATDGCLLPYSCSYDVDGNGLITPGDALCLYEKHLGLCPTSCGPCQDICGDVDMDGHCTLSDVLLVFRAYLNDEGVND